MALKKYNNILTWGRWSNKDTKDAQILALVGVAHKLANDSKITSEDPSRESTKVEPTYIRDIPTWVLEEPKVGVVHKFNNDKE